MDVESCWVSIHHFHCNVMSWNERWFYVPVSNVACCLFIEGRNIYIFGGKSYQRDKEITEVDYYSIQRRKWHTVFQLPSKYSYANVDCVKLNISAQNRDFSFADVQLYDKWILWWSRQRKHLPSEHIVSKERSINFVSTLCHETTSSLQNDIGLMFLPCYFKVVYLILIHWPL